MSSVKCWLRVLQAFFINLDISGNRSGVHDRLWEIEADDQTRYS